MASAFYPRYPGGRLHPECEAVLREIQSSGAKPMALLSPDEARASFLDRSWLGAAPAGVRIECRTLAGPGGALPIRIHRPGQATPGPVLLYFHGGGFVLGALDEFEPFCAMLAEGAGCTVVSVGYRLAPEHPFPAALEDAWAALHWVTAHRAELGGEGARLAVAGDSAGANLAAVLCQRVRGRGFPEPSLQILICPWLDLSEASGGAASFHAFGAGLWLSGASLRWFQEHYLGTAAQAEDVRVSPLRTERLEGVAPALIITAEFDVLADQGRAYALRLEQAGIPVVFRPFPGMLHDFVTLPGRFTEARTAIGWITGAIQGLGAASGA